MKEERTALLRDLVVFALLISVGVAGRWGQPEWCFTPTAAAAVFAGWYFSRWAVACLVPIAILAITDLLLPAYNNLPVMLITYAVMALPVWFGRSLRQHQSGWGAVWRWAVCGLVPATLFYVVTNFAVWAFESNYPKTWAGLVECYWAAVPFYRWMLAGDVVYIAVLFGCAALAGASVFGSQRPATRTIENR